MKQAKYSGSVSDEETTDPTLIPRTVLLATSWMPFTSFSLVPSVICCAYSKFYTLTQYCLGFCVLLEQMMSKTGRVRVAGKSWVFEIYVDEKADIKVIT